MIHVRFSHLDYNVPVLAIAREFYDPLFEFLGFVRETEEPGWVLYANGDFKICLVQCEERFKGAGFHRKRPGLNHLAFEVDCREEVDRLQKQHPGPLRRTGKFSSVDRLLCGFFLKIRSG